MKFIVTQYIHDYVPVDGNYKGVEAKTKYVVSTYDDLQNLLMTLIDFSNAGTKFEVDKVEVDE